MDKEKLGWLVHKATREEFENELSTMRPEDIDELLFEIRLRLSNLNSLIQQQTMFAQAAESYEEGRFAKRKLASLYGAQGWLKTKRDLATRALARLGYQTTDEKALLEMGGVTVGE